MDAKLDEVLKRRKTLRASAANFYLKRVQCIVVQSCDPPVRNDDRGESTSTGVFFLNIAKSIARVCFPLIKTLICIKYVSLFVFAFHEKMKVIRQLQFQNKLTEYREMDIRWKLLTFYLNFRVLLKTNACY